VIIYPVTRELFAFRNHWCAESNRINLRVVADGPPESELGVAKTSPITIMRLPRGKVLIAGSEALKSDLIVDCVCRLLALIHFACPPLTCYAIPNQVLVSPLHQGGEAQAIPGDFPSAVGPLRQQQTQRQSADRETSKPGSGISLSSSEDTRS
jgi:hypothetical protein